MSKPLDLYVGVINLARRPDRKQNMEELLFATALGGTFIEAIDGRVVNTDVRFSITQTQGACWASHQKAYKEFLASGKMYALILEDDVVLSKDNPPNLIVEKLKLLVHHMTSENIGILQLGHVRKFWPLEELRYILNKQNQTFQRVKMIYGDFAGGTHAYLISRSFAEGLIGVNLPVARTADGILEDLARQFLYQRAGQIAAITRLRKSMFLQESRRSSGANLDSDIDF